MKKLVSIILALTLAMAVFTGCADKSETQGEIKPTTTPTTTPTPTVTPSNNPEIEEDPNYPTVLAMWKDMDGYWANAEGEYMNFTLNKDGKAVLYLYDKDGNLTGFAITTAVMASTKTGYYMTFEWPAIKDDKDFKGLTQDAKESSISIEMENYADNYVKIKMDDDEYVVYAKVGKNLDKLSDAVSLASKTK